MTARRILDPPVRQECEARLSQARSQLLRTVATTEEELATLPGREPGAPAEDAAREEIVDLLSRLGDRERHELDEIDAALGRLRADTYGVCEGCGGSIPLPRLQALPATRSCVLCQTIRE